MPNILLGFCAWLAVLAGNSAPARALSPQDIVGTWKRVSTVRQVVGSNTIVDNLGPHPGGILIVTPDLRFVIVETGDGRKPAKTTEEYAALRTRELAFSGIATFSADPDRPNGLKMAGKVDLAWNEEWTGTTQTRFLSVEGNRLTIRTPPSKNPYTGEMGVSTLVWERPR